MTFAAISDAGPLIHLAEIDSLELLTSFESLAIPKTVYEELERGDIPDEQSDLSYELVEADDESLETDELDRENAPP